MKIRVLIFAFFAINSVNSRGLKEEFTWTRISYLWPREARFGGYGGYGGWSSPGQRPDFSGEQIFFPGMTNAGQTNNRPPKNKVQEQPSSNRFEGAASHQMNPNTNSNNNANVNNVDGGEFYIYQNNIPMGVNRWQNKLFVTVPRRRIGVPSTLNYVPLNSTERHNVPLIPYPNWDANQLANRGGERIVSIYRVAIDACDRLWAVDTGMIETPGNQTIFQPYGIIIIDLRTDTIISRYNLKSTDTRPTSTLASIVVDVTPTTCNDAYAYIPDLGAYGVVVYSLRENDSWRVSHNYFFLEPLAGNFNIGGQVFQWNDGVFSLALSGPDRNGFRKVYFHAMAGTHIYSVSTSVLKNQRLATRSFHGNDFLIEGDRDIGFQSSASDLHVPTGVLFLGLVNQNALGCWNTNKKLIQSNIGNVQKDDRRMIYPCDVKVYGNDVIVLTNAMPVFLYGRLNYDEVNFRVWIANVQNAIAGTPCALESL